MLHYVSLGQTTNLTPVLIVPGLFGSARNWGAIAKTLSATRRVISVDMRNHGQSPWFDTHNYPEMADDLAQVIQENAPMDIIGHSMGGKAAMALALSRPDLIRRLLIADIAPVPYDHSHSHFINTMRNLDLSRIEKRSDADHALAVAIPDAGVRAFLLQSLDIKNRKWRLNLDVLEREMPKIIGFPDYSNTFENPALFLSGGNSDYVLHSHRPVIKALFPKARFARIPDTGHWLHAEKPRVFEESAQLFFGQHD